MTRMRYEIEIELLEDLHTGSGTGGGGVDALQARDAWGRPVIRASHFTGLLRERALELVDWGAVEPESVGALFGSPGGQRSALLMTSFTLSPGDSAATQVWASTRRIPHSRRPADETLRSREFVPAKQSFKGEVELTNPTLADLFERCVGRVDVLGARRSRGAGHVRITCTREDAPERAMPAAGDRLRLRLCLRAREPLCLARTGVPGNIIPTESFIRGQRLRAALASWLAESGQPSGWVFWPDVLAGDGRPHPARSPISNLDQLEIRPIPLSIRTPKPTASAKDWPSWARTNGGALPGSRLGSRGEVDALLASQPNDDVKRKRPRDAEYLFRARPTDPWRRFSPIIGTRLRNGQLNRRADERIAPELFADDEIAAETRFIADLDFETVDARDRFVDALAPVLSGASWLRIGRGGRPVEVEQIAWLSQPVVSRGPTDRLTLTLDSDSIIRTPTLGFRDHIDVPALRDALGEEGATLPDVDLEGTVDGTVEIHGFNGASRLPRAPALALRRGSVCVLTGHGVTEWRTLLQRRASEGRWLGERTAEGFGRFTLDLSLGLGRTDGEARGDSCPVAVDADEERLADAEGWIENHWGSFAEVRRTGWHMLRQSARALIPKDSTGESSNLIAEVLDRLIAHSGTRAGEPWAGGRKTLEDLAEACRRRNDAAAYLEAIARFALTRAPAAEEGLR